MSFCTQTRDTPYSRATSLLLRPSIVTAVITSRAIDMAHLRVKEGANYVPRQVLTISCNQSPPGAPLSPLVSAFSCAHASIRARCRRALGAIVGAIGLQQHLGHPGCGCALLAFYEMPVHVFCYGDARVSENLRDHIEIGAWASI